MPPSNVRYRFGPFEVHLRARQLYKHGTRLKLRPQAFQILQLLLERAGDVVTREELRQHVWSSETFVDFEHGLNTAIKELRGALSDSATQPRYIETLPKLGYRAVMDVEREAAEPMPTRCRCPSPSAQRSESTLLSLLRKMRLPLNPYILSRENCTVSVAGP